jgi:hypothetical protein
MIASKTLKLQQYQDGFPLPGCWKLAPERAVTLNPTEPGVLRIAQGQVWATLDGPHHGPANDWGDVVLHSGEQLQLMPGQHVVVEPFGDAVNEPVYFSWEPSSGMTQPAVPGNGSGWADIVPHQPAVPDHEISIFVRASGHLLSRLGGFLMHFVAGKGRVLSPLETNQP